MTVVLSYAVAAGLLVPTYGLGGAVDAYVIQSCVAVFVMAGILGRRGLFVPSRLTVRAFLATGVVLFAISRPEPSRPVGALVALVFTGALLLFCTGDDEREALRARVAGRLRR